MTSATPLEQFQQRLDFRLDRFQVEAIDALIDGRSTLVAAPTGAGKTVVGEFAMWHALQHGGRAFYTTPIKALSNQKFRDLVDEHGAANVGLLTGDNVVNGDAPLVVMTTEVLRNMIYEGSRALLGLSYVVLDEVHYLADRERGAVWEEVIVQLAESVQIAALSATVSNAEEFGAWLADVRGGCDVIVSELRPVPLEHHYAINSSMYPTFKSGAGGKGGKKPDKEAQARAAQARGGRPNPEVVMLERRSGQRNRVTRKGRRVGGGEKLKAPWRSDLVRMLGERKWLPAIVFIFSRKACDDAVDQVMRSGAVLTSDAEREKIREVIARRTAELTESDLRVLRFPAWAASLEAGVAAHHAGMVPMFKETVEELFSAGLIKVVYATETLALGINMPARTVVIERLEKWNGQRHELLTPGQFTQLTGRAGRRGKDTLGHAVVAYQRDVDFATVTGLVGRRTERLVSRFTPTYNMAVNLLRRMSTERAVELLEQSFAQHQADAQVGPSADEIAKNRKAMAGYAQHLHSDVGDFTEYWALRREISRVEQAASRNRKQRRAAAVEDGIAALRPGDVIVLGSGRRSKEQLAAVVETTRSKAGTPLVVVVGEDRQFNRVGPREFDRAPVAVGGVKLPGGHHRQPKFRRQVQQALFDVTPRRGANGPEVAMDPEDEARIAELRERMRSHPVHADPELSDIEVWARRHDELRAATERLERNVRRRTTSLVARFHSIIVLLQRLGYLDDEPSPTAQGLTLARLYANTDLVLAEALRWGSFDGLSGPELAAVLSMFTFESRTEEDGFLLPTPSIHDAVADIDGIRARIVALETEHGLPPTRVLDASFAAIAYRWTSGADLDTAIGSRDMTAGDFVRSIKMLADLIRQVREVTDGGVRDAAHEANKMLVRGVVAY